MKRSPAEPYWNNGWFGTLDAAALMFLLADRKPKTYVEGGSGFCCCARSRSTSSPGATSPESYLAACAALSGVAVVTSFDRDIDRVTSIRRLEPSA